ncbi:MAG: energy-coupling factor ABC transporter permease [bacterium]|nr:energy-coupling factor ABC transporter permease [bacterium]
MADALLSPAVGGTAWAATAGLIGYSSRKLRDGMDDRRIPLMGVLGAFIFAAQMINFTIPATGSSGHLGGGLILAILLGPQAAFLTLASVLTVQAMFFADGGLLALGCNIFNLGFFPCFVAYPFIYRTVAGGHKSRWRIVAASGIAALIGLQLGSAAVVVETTMSGVTELPFWTFLLVMQPVHLAIGLVEGAVTAAVVLFVLRARPEILEAAQGAEGSGPVPLRGLAAALLAAAIAMGAGLSWFASSNPDGLEWSIAHTSGSDTLEGADEGMHRSLGNLQDRTAILPDYGFREGTGEREPGSAGRTDRVPGAAVGTSVSGLLGGMLTLLLAGAAGVLLRWRRVRT